MASVKDSPEVMRLEVVETGRRRRWTEEEKLRIVMESLSGPRLGLVTARRYGIARSLLATWRRRFGVQAAGASRFVPAVVVPERTVSPSPSSRMEIVATSGRRIIVDVGVDAAALSRVLDVLERR
ncbi:transposase [uncultured Reyranella sp.]|mgnify:CR=1 FL=1|jgi:transposase|uniref:IS66-like element accessory protein TnpA n=1 Tax=uncultured Reyranella sp. TaxID=735512 RepID=UPI0025EBDF48|nr:transposase [uncultured Reyranella sp.]